MTSAPTTIYATAIYHGHIQSFVHVPVTPDHDLDFQIERAFGYLAALPEAPMWPDGTTGLIQVGDRADLTRIAPWRPGSRSEPGRFALPVAA